MSQEPQRDKGLKRVSMFSISFLLSSVFNKCGWEGGDYGYSGCLFGLMMSLVVVANTVNRQTLS